MLWIFALIIEQMQLRVMQAGNTTKKETEYEKSFSAKLRYYFLGTKSLKGKHLGLPATKPWALFKILG